MRIDIKRAQRKLTIVYLIISLLLLLAAYIASIFELYPVDPQEMDLSSVLSAPFSHNHLLGTDYLGRDTLSRLMLGTQAYLLPGLFAVFISIFFGAFIGCLSIFSGQKIKYFINFINDTTQSLPRLVLLLLIISIFEPDIYIIMLVIGISNIPAVSTLVSRRVDLLKEKSFIQSAIAMAIPLRSIIWKHVLWYNCRSLLFSQSALIMAEAILLETSLSYLGFGVQEPQPSWGNMVQSGSNYLLQGEFWASSIPALAIMFVLTAFYLLSDYFIKQQKEKH